MEKNISMTLPFIPEDCTNNVEFVFYPSVDKPYTIQTSICEEHAIDQEDMDLVRSVMFSAKRFDKDLRKLAE